MIIPGSFEFWNVPNLAMSLEMRIRKTARLLR